jgi:hypothetical protein
MHAAFAAWVTAQPWRAVILAAVFSCLPLPFPVRVALAAALAVLLVLRTDLRMAVIAAVVAAIAPAVMLGIWTPPARAVLLVGGVLLAVPLGCGWLLARSGSLNLCFQLGVLLAGLLVVGLHVSLGDPATVLLSGLVREALQKMPQDADPAVREAMQAMLLSMLWGWLIVLSLIGMLSALFLGRWWSSLLNAEAKGSFGTEYRALRLGKVLGLAVTAIVLGAWWLDSGLLESLVWVSAAACFFQGLSAAHRRKARGMLDQGYLTAMYASLVIGFPALLLTAWGFADTWRQLLTPSV